jgi:hypothetical protein
LDVVIVFLPIIFLSVPSMRSLAVTHVQEQKHQSRAELTNIFVAAGVDAEHIRKVSAAIKIKGAAELVGHLEIILNALICLVAAPSGIPFAPDPNSVPLPSVVLMEAYATIIKMGLQNATQTQTVHVPVAKRL